MPLTPTGRKVLKKFIEQYGEEEGKKYFYAAINKGVKGSEKWHKRRKRKYSYKDLTS
ncbi:MAG: hypothetical protein QXX45_03270 [Candidatus Aenigmatarchaeota archaeon]